MGNKYSSNIRTYTARNLLWNCDAAQPVPYLMAAPAALTVKTPNSANNSMLPVFYYAQYPTETDWNRQSFLTIKRAGIYSNFADGLVQKQDTSRVTMTIRAGIYTPYGIPGSITFTQGSNKVTGTGFNNLAFTPGKVVLDVSGALGYPYFIQSVASDTEAYLTDYARVTSDPQGISMMILDSSRFKEFQITNLATLNSLYESEIFFPYCPTLGAERLFLSCAIGIDNQSDTTLDFFTKTIATSFNGSAVSFDSVLEAEISPYIPVPLP